ncbi:MAG: 4Fe-4S binding protein [Desulfonauticus sp.]|nr:4Fe-4S binding protein [Desulfonauticus sp.]
MNYPSWRTLELGAAITTPGNAAELKTGDWRTEFPVLDEEKCVKCGLCAIYCPEFCIHEDDTGYFRADLYYCKGCGICVHECPKDALTMQLEEK